MRSKLLAATILAAGLATSAHAQSSQGFAGPYAGGQIGHDSFNARFSDGTDSAKLGVNGIQGGIFAGYNFQMENFVAGVEAQLNLTDAKSSGSLDGTTFDVDGKYGYGLSARAGALLSDSALLYVHGGWTRTKFGVDFGAFDDKATYDGWKAGLGLEVLVTENVSARGEYAYTDYESRFGIEPKNNSVQFGIAWHF